MPLVLCCIEALTELNEHYLCTVHNDCVYSAGCLDLFINHHLRNNRIELSAIDAFLARSLAYRWRSFTETIFWCFLSFLFFLSIAFRCFSVLVNPSNSSSAG